MSTPNDLQWTNGRGLIAGAKLLGVMTIVLGIFATLGIWKSSGVLPPNGPAGAVTASMLAPGTASRSFSATPIRAAQIQGLAAVATSGSASDISTGTLSAARLPVATTTTLGGISAPQAPANRFATGVSPQGALQYAQPAFGNISGTLAPGQLPASGVTAGRYGGSQPTHGVAGANNTIPLLQIDSLGRVLSASQQAISAIAYGDVYGIGGTVARTLNDHFYDHLSVRDFGAVCDGNTDDTKALNAAFATGYYIELPPQTCVFKTAPLLIGLNYQRVQGSGMWGASHLVYAGTNTDTDLVVIGSLTAPTNTSGVTSQGYQQPLADVTISSNTKMTGGNAVRSWGTQFIRMRNVALGRQQDPVNLWNGFSFNQEDHNVVDGYFVTAQNDCFQMYGFGAEPGSGTHTPGSGSASGPQYEVWVDHGKMGNCNIGVHVGGGIDGVYVDHSMVTFNNYDLVVDNALSPHPNQEIVFGSQAFMDFAAFDNVLVNDPKCVPGIMCEVSISGPVLHAGETASPPVGIAGTSQAGASAPANSGNGIHIKAYPLGSVDFQSSYSIDYLNAAVLTEDNTAQLYMNPGMHVGTSPAGSAAGRAKYGVISVASGAFAPKAMPFVESMANVATPISNVTTPSLSSPTGALRIGLGATANPYAEAVISNLGAEGIEFTCAGYVAAYALPASQCRDLYYNRVAGAYVGHVSDAAGHSFRVGGTERGEIVAAGVGTENHLFGYGFAPTVTASAGTATTSAGINDNHGTINQSAAGTVTIKFAAAYVNPPDCVVTAQNGVAPSYTAAGGAAGTAALSVTVTAAAKFTYVCMGR